MVRPPFPFALSLVGALAIGSCAKSPEAASTSQSKGNEKPAPQQGVRLGKGDASAFDPLQRSERKWTIRWEEARLASDQQWDPAAGDLRKVTGDIFENQSVKSRFWANQGRADRKRETLVLFGAVRVRDLTENRELVCDELDYLEGAKLLIAKGNVRFRTETGEIGTFKELRATADLRIVGTPAMFSERKKSK